MLASSHTLALQIIKGDLTMYGVYNLNILATNEKEGSGRRGKKKKMEELKERQRRNERDKHRN